MGTDGGRLVVTTSNYVDIFVPEGRERQLRVDRGVIKRHHHRRVKGNHFNIETTECADEQLDYVYEQTAKALETVQ